jgi:hypothetical protein
MAGQDKTLGSPWPPLAIRPCSLPQFSLPESLYSVGSHPPNVLSDEKGTTTQKGTTDVEDLRIDIFTIMILSKGEGP